MKLHTAFSGHTHVRSTIMSNRRPPRGWSTLLIRTMLNGVESDLTLRQHRYSNHITSRDSSATRTSVSCANASVRCVSSPKEFAPDVQVFRLCLPKDVVVPHHGTNLQFSRRCDSNLDTCNTVAEVAIVQMMFAGAQAHENEMSPRSPVSDCAHARACG